MSAFRALRRRDFSLYFFGQLVSMVGTWMQNVALGYWVYRITGKESMLALVMFAATAPSVLLMPLGGLVADRMPARRLLLITQTVYLLQALGMAALVFLGTTTMGPILLLAVFLGAITAFDLPARQVLVAQVVDREELPNAIALQSTLFHGSRILGPALAGLMVAASGEGWCFVLNAASYLAALATLFVIRTHPVADARSGRGSLEHLAEGFRFVWNEKLFRHLLGLLILIVGLGMPFTALLPAVAKGTLHVGPRELGWLGAASGLGATVGAVLLASRKTVQGLERALALFTLLFALFLGAFAMTHHYWLALALLPFASFCLACANTSCNTLAQMLAPDALRGRVMALYTMVFMAAMPLGILAMGFLAQFVSLSWALAFGAAGCLIGGLVFAGTFPKAPAKPADPVIP